MKANMQTTPNLIKKKRKEIFEHVEIVLLDSNRKLINLD